MLKNLLTYVIAVVVIVFALVAIGLFALLVFSSSKLANFVSTTIPAVPRIFLRCVKLFLVAIMLLLVITLAAVVVAVAVGNTRYSTTRDEAFRSLEHHSTACDIENSWSILALQDNDELKAIETDEKWKHRFRCVLQVHSLSDENATDVNNPTTQDQPSAARAQPLRYYLGFIEFKEDGNPQSLVDDNDNPAYVSDSHGSLMLGQLSVIEDHLKNHASNFVVAFVHGWRHDASIGDTNVRDARHYGAHVARFLADRCEKDKQIEFCGATVTVVYIGWRGARVDERKLQQHFGVVGEWIGTMAAIPTLFDRKPISEEVGPSTVTALRQLYNSMPEGRLKKMIVFGHSLGGNLLISTLKDYMVKMVGRHQSGRWIDDKPSLADLIKSPIGSLVVLINPASEAANWTAIQRAVWNRIPYRESESIPGSTVDDGHLFFRQDQPPVLISVTAARSWPASGLRPDDCAWLFHYDPNEPKRVTDEKAKMRPLVEKSTDMFKDGVEYDRATYDLFPLFKFDLRPVAQSLDRFAKRLAVGDKIRSVCETPAEPGFWTISSRLGWLASVLRNMPFMNTDREQTRTVGHLDPPRPPMGAPINKTILSFRPLGTTHELFGNPTSPQKPLKYSAIATDPTASCPSVRGWLWNARQEMIDKDPSSHGTFWDSDDLTSARPAARFLHSFANSGTAAVTRANDPFWNMRAFDTALSRHDGYLLSSFICAMNQIVMDDITAKH